MQVELCVADDPRFEPVFVLRRRRAARLSAMDEVAPAGDRWTEDRQVLQAVVDLGQSGQILLPEQIAVHLERPADDVREPLLRLASADPPFAQFQVARASVVGNEVASVSLPTERALRTCEVWTSAETALDRIADALEAMIDQADTEDERTRLRRVLDAIKGPRDVWVQVLGVALQIGAAGLGLGASG
jgi:hypothetical protein